MNTTVERKVIMKIVQFMTTGQGVDTVITGMGDDGMMYIWDMEEGSWMFFKISEIKEKAEKKAKKEEKA